LLQFWEGVGTNSFSLFELQVERKLCFSVCHDGNACEETDKGVYVWFSLVSIAANSNAIKDGDQSS